MVNPVPVQRAREMIDEAMRVYARQCVNFFHGESITKNGGRPNEERG